MLFNENEGKLENSFGPVLGQLRSPEKRLEKDADLKISYRTTLTNDIGKSYISELPAEELDNQDVWYLLQYPVVNPKKPKKMKNV